MNMAYAFIRNFIISEAKVPKQNKLVQIRLKYSRGDLDPIISEETINYHYGKLYKGYVDRFNSGEGDVEFNEAGSFLHKLYFEQFTAPSTNYPTDDILKFINKHFDNFTKFKDTVEEIAMSIQGSGWVYLSKNGQIKTIKNHSIRSDIILLIDWWEHAWALDYQENKNKYLSNIWKIIDWSVIESRLS